MAVWLFEYDGEVDLGNAASICFGKNRTISQIKQIIETEKIVA